MNSLVKAFVIKIWKLFLGTFGIVRRAFCCFRRRRRASDVSLPISASSFTERSTYPNCQASDLQSWDSWNEDNQPMVTVESSCTNNTSSSNRRKYDGFKDKFKEGGDEALEDNIDFFSDMKPQVKRQKKYVPRFEDGVESRGLSSRIKMDLQPSFSSGAELGCLEDQEVTWEEVAELEDLGDVDSAIREKRLAEREQRLAEHQRRKREKEMKRGSRPHLSSTGMSS